MIFGPYFGDGRHNPSWELFAAGWWSVRHPQLSHGTIIDIRVAITNLLPPFADTWMLMSFPRHFAAFVSTFVHIHEQG